MADKLYIVYRISDKGFDKPKLPNGGKWDCLANAIKEFGAENFHVIADNCTDETVDALKSTGLNLEITANGNSGTCRHIFNEVIDRYESEDFLYLLEDDYLHLPGSRQALLEGLQIADYVTLYDHFENYQREGSMNPFVHDDLPKSSIYLTDHTHWREIISTTMTFAAKVQTLREDREVFIKFCQWNIPADYGIFATLTGQDDLNEAKFFAKTKREGMAKVIIENFIFGRKKRLLISPLPSFATHTPIGCLAPLIDWSRI